MPTNLHKNDCMGFVMTALQKLLFDDGPGHLKVVGHVISHPWFHVVDAFPFTQLLLCQLSQTTDRFAQTANSHVS